LFIRFLPIRNQYYHSRSNFENAKRPGIAEGRIPRFRV
jgi:hypothetical protein